MAVRRKVMDVCEGGCHLEVYRINDRKELNQYRVIRICGGHRNQIAAYGDWMSVLYFMKDFWLAGADTMTLDEIKEWWRKGFAE